MSMGYELVEKIAQLAFENNWSEEKAIEEYEDFVNILEWNDGRDDAEIDKRNLLKSLRGYKQ